MRKSVVMAVVLAGVLFGGRGDEVAIVSESFEDDTTSVSIQMGAAPSEASSSGEGLTLGSPPTAARRSDADRIGAESGGGPACPVARC